MTIAIYSIFFTDSEYDSYSDCGSDQQDTSDDEPIKEAWEEQPLHESSDITLGEAVVAIGCFIKRHNTSRQLLIDFLRLLQFLFNLPNCLPRTPYKFYKLMDFNKPKTNLDYYCTRCGNGVVSLESTCTHCSPTEEGHIRFDEDIAFDDGSNQPADSQQQTSSHDISRSASISDDQDPRLSAEENEDLPNGEIEDSLDAVDLNVNQDPANSYVLNLSIEEQMSSIVQRLFDKLQKPTEETVMGEILHDIYNGSIYQQLFSEGALEWSDSVITLTMMWDADGIRFTKSSLWAAWIFRLVINELPQNLRHKKENVIVGNIWFGDSKPITNLYMRGVKVEVLELMNGIEVTLPNGKLITVKIIVMCGKCDLQAKAMMLNLHQWNGKWGCNNCLHEGTMIDRVRVYPVQENELRTDEGTEEHATKALVTGKPFLGVKAPSMFAKMVYKYVTSTGIDKMHNMYGGHAKFHVQLIFDDEFKDFDYSLCEYSNFVDQVLPKIKSPWYVKRIPREFTKNRPHLKANELKNWMHYYSLPILSKIMSPEYLECHKLLLLGIAYLSATSVTPHMLKVGEAALFRYTRLFQDLYGEKSMVMNSHLIEHLALIVQRLGPLHTSICFTMEDFLGKLKKDVHGTKDPQKQLVSAIARTASLSVLKAKVMKKNSRVYDLVQSFNSGCGKLKRALLYGNFWMLGKSLKVKEKSLTAEVRQALCDAGQSGKQYWTYSRLLKGRSQFHSTAYTRPKKTNSTCVSFNCNGQHQFGIIRTFIKIKDCSCKSICKCASNDFALISTCQVDQCFKVNLAVDGKLESFAVPNVHKQERISQTLSLIGIEDLKEVCFYIDVPELSYTYIAEPINSVEEE